MSSRPACSTEGVPGLAPLLLGNPVLKNKQKTKLPTNPKSFQINDTTNDVTKYCYEKQSSNMVILNVFVFSLHVAI